MARTVKIRRAETVNGMVGILTINNFPCCLTLERPWDENKVNVSCIPPGKYSCKRVISPRWGDTFEVCDVPGRTLIRFHEGCTAEKSKGCILFGTFVGVIDNHPAVLHSVTARRKFMDEMGGIDEFDLEIS